MAARRRRTRSGVERIADRVRRTLDRGIDATEGFHRRVGNLPLDILERSDALESTARDVRRLQERAIRALYDLLRGVNRNATRLAKNALGPPRTRRPRAPRKPVKKVAHPPHATAA